LETLLVSEEGDMLRVLNEKVWGKMAVKKKGG
jgi:hypothetical protein